MSTIIAIIFSYDNMRSVILASIVVLIATMRISHPQEEDRRIQEDDDRGVNPYSSTLPSIDCQSLPRVLSPEVLCDLDMQFGCPSKLVCAESTNKDISRSRLYHFFRMQSKLLVSGTCPFCIKKRIDALRNSIHYSNIFLMRQNWYLEYSANFFFAKHGCPLTMAIKIPGKDYPNFGDNYNLGTLPDIVSCDTYFTVTSKRMKPQEKQEDAVAFFIERMTAANDLLKTWNDTDYTLGSASHYGCAVIVKDGVTGVSGIGEPLENDRAAYLACVFVAYDSLESYTGDLNDYTCDRNFGLAEYFSSIHASLCVHINLELNPTGAPFDIGCEEKYTNTMCLKSRAIPVKPNAKWKTTNRTDGKPAHIEQFTYFDEEKVDDRRNNGRPVVDFLSGVEFFMLMAVATFFLLAFVISFHSRTLD